uniref:Major facilitator superfamily (MFS) profile domain-containing protein n=1 Tax=Graphocephala atropunctata TaxID=36148 RepID=A0A1B6M8X2_9HEMI
MDNDKKDVEVKYTVVIGEDHGLEIADVQANPRRIHLFSSIAILNIAYVVLGTTFAWSSPMLLKLQLPSDDASTVASTISLGGMIGPFVTGAIVDRLGRKGTTAVSMGLTTGSYLLLTVGRSVLVLSAGRFLAGLSFGIVFSAVPMYIAEISEDSVRGVLNTLNMISIASGSLLMFGVAPFVSYELIHYLILGLCSLFFLLFPLLPESPHYLVMKDKTKRARTILTWLREDQPAPYVEIQLQIIQKTMTQEEQQPLLRTALELFSLPGNHRAFIICFTLIVLQQLTGITIVVFYLQEIIKMTRVDFSSSTCSIAVGLVKLVAGFICPLAVRYFGYKRTLMGSTFGTAVGMGGLGVFFSLKSNNFDVNSMAWLPLFSVGVYFFSFVAGLSSIPWALTGELFPSNVKSIATCLITASSAFLSFVSGKFFPNLIDLIGIDFLFFSCSLFGCFSVVFIVLVVDETSGLSFVQIQELLNGRKRKEVLLEQPN